MRLFRPSRCWSVAWWWSWRKGRREGSGCGVGWRAVFVRVPVVMNVHGDTALSCGCRSSCSCFCLSSCRVVVTMVVMQHRCTEQHITHHPHHRTANQGNMQVESAVFHTRIVEMFSIFSSENTRLLSDPICATTRC